LPTDTENTFILSLGHSWTALHYHKNSPYAPNKTQEGSIACYRLLPHSHCLLSLLWRRSLCQKWELFFVELQVKSPWTVFLGSDMDMGRYLLTQLPPNPTAKGPIRAQTCATDEHSAYAYMEYDIVYFLARSNAAGYNEQVSHSSGSNGCNDNDKQPRGRRCDHLVDELLINWLASWEYTSLSSFSATFFQSLS